MKTLKKQSTFRLNENILVTAQKKFNMPSKTKVIELALSNLIKKAEFLRFLEKNKGMHKFNGYIHD